MQHITNLAKIVNSITENRHLWEYIFLSKDADDQLELVIFFPMNHIYNYFIILKERPNGQFFTKFFDSD